MVARAKAFTKAALWKHAAPGTIEALLVPYYLEETRRSNGAAAEKLKDQETEERARVQAGAMNAGLRHSRLCLVSWVRYKVTRKGAESRIAAKIRRRSRPECSTGCIR